MHTFPRPDRSTLAAAIVAAIAAVLALAAVDPAGDYPDAPQGPGLTIDEMFNVQNGVRLAVAGRIWLLGGLTWRELFGGPEELGPDPPAGYHLPDHPPLGRLWLGLVHQVVIAAAPPRDHPGPFVTAAARCGSALAFAATVFLVGWAAGRWHGVTGALAASVGLVLMPRVFGHAHIAALETCIGLAYASVVLSLAFSWSTDEAPATRTALWTGFVFGLAMLTKIQAILLPAPIALWALWRWRLRAIRPLAVWGIAGLATFFALWPWLWFDPVGHFQQYLGRTTDRISLGVWYLGERFADRDVPWHFPWVMFAVTVPLGLHLLGALGIADLWRRRAGLQQPSVVADAASVGESHKPSSANAGEHLALACLIVPLVVFGIPGVAVYDGERLFLVSFPLWALLIGRGAAAAMSGGTRSASPATASGSAPTQLRPRRGRAAMLMAFVGLQAIGLFQTAPCWLTYYNVLVGGESGASRLGLERCYWGDAVTRELLEQLAEAAPPGAVVDVAPVLHQFQVRDLHDQCPALRSKAITLRPWDETKASDFILVFDRLADLPAALREAPAGLSTLAEVRRGGVRLAAVYHKSDE